MNVYILTEITKRELDSNLLLSILMAEKNGEVLISNMDNLNYLNKKNLLKKGILHTKSLVHDETKQNFHLDLTKNGILITSLDEENGLVKKNLNNFAERRFTKDALKLVEKVFCWGQHDFEVLKKKYNEHESKFILTGASRTDTWSKKFKSYWRDQNNEKKEEDIVLISLNFGLVNGHYSIEEILKREDKAGYFNRCKDSKNEILQIYEKSKKLIIEFKKLINYLSQELPDVKFHVRPHPREKIVTWKKSINERDNVIINNDGNINSNLSHSKILIHNNCTTAFQASMYDLPVISYAPLENNDYSVSNHLGTIIETEIDAKKNIEQILHTSNEIKYKDRESIIESKLFIPKNSLCSENIVNTWQNLFNTKLKNCSKNNWKIITINLRIYNFFTNMKKTIFKLINPEKKIIKDEKFEEINIELIKDKIDRIKKIININSKFDIVKIANKSFLIKKKHN